MRPPAWSIWPGVGTAAEHCKKLPTARSRTGRIFLTEPVCGRYNKSKDTHESTWGNTAYFQVVEHAGKFFVR